LLTDTLGSREQRELALRILESTTRIEFVLDDLQYYSQPVRIATIPVRLQDVMDRLLATLDEDDRHRVTLGVEQPRGAVLADPDLLRQALLALIQNAFDATSPDKHAALHIAFDTDTVRFTVSNQGTIDLDEAAHKVFDPFFTTKAQNLGIGLSMARRIAEAHGGTLYLAANDRLQGTCFTLELPVPTEADFLI
ncbi:MAG: sensor histidine kinase, partial [Rhodothermales bacterium]